MQDRFFEDRYTEPVFVRGVGLSCALGNDTDACVDVLHHGHPTPIQLREDGPTPCASYYRINDDAPLFEPSRFDRLLPKVTRAAVAEAALSATDMAALPIFLGSTCFSIGRCEAGYASALEKDRRSALPMPDCGYQTLLEPIQRALGCRGDTYAYNTACSASANALLAATRMIQLGWYPHALVVGAELANRTSLAGFSGLQLLATDLRPFDLEREGLVLGEGIGAVILSATPGNKSSLRLLGGANSCDTGSITTADPDGHAVATVIRKALEQTNVPIDAIRGIKAHGTGTPSGDTAEANGITAALGEPPALYAMKPWLGHTLGACGVVELGLFASTLKRGWIPGTPGFRTPDPSLDFRPCSKVSGAPQGYYLFNHFGFGGNNTVLVVEKPA